MGGEGGTPPRKNRGFWWARVPKGAGGLGGVPPPRKLIETEKFSSFAVSLIKTIFSVYDLRDPYGVLGIGSLGMWASGTTPLGSRSSAHGPQGLDPDNGKEGFHRNSCNVIAPHDLSQKDANMGSTWLPKWNQND